jgi:uracil phosphoribosyltransferase
MSGDVNYQAIPYRLSEFEHGYGERVHLLSDPLAFTLLARMSTAATVQPEFNRIVRRLYGMMMAQVAAAEFPRESFEAPTRMAASTPRGVLSGQRLVASTPVVCVDIARAGTVPSQLCYDFCNDLLDPAVVRQDHLTASRTTGADHHVNGVSVQGAKIGGRIDGAILLLPDPMGATGTSVAATVRHYLASYGDPAKFVVMNLIVTPQFVRAVTAVDPRVVVYAWRLDRGMSDDEVLRTPFGQFADREDGLNENDYIVPGAGGVGELMNNAFV